jgi:hypothetical protein
MFKPTEKQLLEGKYQKFGIASADDQSKGSAGDIIDTKAILR